MADVQNEIPEEIAIAVTQICSSSFQQMFEEVIKEQPDPLSNDQYTLLKRYPIQVSWYEGNQRDKIVERVRRAHSKWFDNWLIRDLTPKPPSIVWSTLIDDILLQEMNLLFRMDCGDVIISEETRTEFKQIAQTIRDILLSIIESNPEIMNESVIPIVQTLLSILFYLTWDDQLVTYLKSLKLVEMMNKLLKISNNDDEIHLQVYRILAAIMTETDVKEMENANRFAHIFIRFLENIIDAGPSFEARFHNCLRSLKSISSSARYS